jgi:uncharacterized Zn-binding protein involved in type VI secretion
VTIGFMPAWRALPSSVGTAVEGITNSMDSFMKTPVMTPANAAVNVAQISACLVMGGVVAAAAGVPTAADMASAQATVINSTNTALTTAWTSASAVPGGQPAANNAYTEGIKAVAATAAIATMTAIGALADMHVCPVPVPIPPHGPGMVTQGSSSVFINKLPAARQGDKVMEACGGADPITMGCATVDIGDSGGGGGGGGGGAGGGAAGAAASQGAAAGAAGEQDGRGFGVGLAIIGAGLVAGAVYAAYRYFRGRCHGHVLRQQERGMSCAQATTSMIIRDRTGTEVSEETLRNESAARGHPPGYDPVNGTNDGDVVTMLNDHGVANNGLQYNPSVEDIRNATSGGRSAMIGLGNPGHWVIADGVRDNRDGSQSVLLRDPGIPGRGGCREINTNSAEWNNRVAAAGANPVMISFPE